jgi:hypothetical protein
MKHISLLSIFFLSFLQLHAQNSDCLVLLDSISGTYEGECKKGKAHGFGIADGLHKYEGNFRKGWPFGEGTYTWDEGRWYKGWFRNGLKNGYGKLHSNRIGEDTLLVGYWRNNHYLGEEDLADFEIIERMNLENISLNIRNIDGTSLRIKILRDKATNSQAVIRMLNSSSGHGRKGSGSVVYENIEFPFHFSIHYDTPNRFNTTSISCVVEVIINTPGEWEVKLEN